MPKSKLRKKRQPYKPRVKEVDFKTLSGIEQYRLLRGKDELPKCKICGSDTELASDEDVNVYKGYDATYPYNFIIAPKCSCWETHQIWME